MSVLDAPEQGRNLADYLLDSIYKFISSFDTDAGGDVSQSLSCCYCWLESAVGNVLAVEHLVELDELDTCKSQPSMSQNDVSSQESSYPSLNFCA
jgi:hypothetical protein